MKYYLMHNQPRGVQFPQLGTVYQDKAQFKRRGIGSFLRVPDLYVLSAKSNNRIHQSHDIIAATPKQQFEPQRPKTTFKKLSGKVSPPPKPRKDDDTQYGDSASQTVNRPLKPPISTPVIGDTPVIENSQSEKARKKRKASRDSLKQELQKKFRVIEA